MKNRFLDFVFFGLIFAVSAPSLALAGDLRCKEWRIAFDIGSTSTKVKAYEVNTCSSVKQNIQFSGKTISLDQKVKEVVLPMVDGKTVDTLEVKYRDNLKANQSLSPKINDVSPAVQDQGIEALKNLKSMASMQIIRQNHSDINVLRKMVFVGVATSGFRDWHKANASSVESFIARIKKEAHIEVKTISQKQEALMGFIAAVTSKNSKPKNIVSWDIGGGSWQIMAADRDGTIEMFTGTIASKSFKDSVLSQIKSLDPKTVSNPNPLSSLEMTQAIDLSEKLTEGLGEYQPAAHWIHTHAHARVIGIGGVHGKSIPSALKQASTGKDHYFKQKHLKLCLDHLVGKSPQGDFSETIVTNLVYVYGIMKGFDLGKVYIADVNLADALARQADLAAWNL